MRIKKGDTDGVEDSLYILPAMTFSVILLGTSVLFFLRYLLLILQRRGANPPQGFTLRTFMRVSGIALLIALERILYRYGTSFMLGVELTVLKVRPIPCF